MVFPNLEHYSRAFPAEQGVIEGSSILHQSPDYFLTGLLELSATQAEPMVAPPSASDKMTS